jgi:hypothetical protein
MLAMTPVLAAPAIDILREPVPAATAGNQQVTMVYCWLCDGLRKGVAAVPLVHAWYCVLVQ